ncbi:MAG: carbonic anhydrase family protein [Lentimicrobiaceae bacterium]|nr:carbonic anhydrase family protein [Lentimicrobiaceae bacterium]MCL2302310.1 carbonic anhydrase family protein [Lentimicrobiaceae bacterium]
MVKFFIPVIALAVLVSCGENQTKIEKHSKVLSKEEQANLTPDMVIEILKKGNEEFVHNELTVRNNPELIRDAANGQYPMAVILSCLDSRVPVEDVFHRAIGDIFVARVAGNIVNTDILGSMEFACKASGAKLIMVLGHGACGAVKSAISNVELGNITEMLSKIKPAVSESRAEFTGDATASNAEFVDIVGINNVALAVQEIRDRSPILKEMEDKGEIKIIGGYYDMHTGKVEFFENM